MEVKQLQQQRGIHARSTASEESRRSGMINPASFFAVGESWTRDLLTIVLRLAQDGEAAVKIFSRFVELLEAGRLEVDFDGLQIE